MEKKKFKTGSPKLNQPAEDLGELASKLPKKPLDLENVIYWADLGATQEEISGAFHMSVDVFSRQLKKKYGITFAEIKERCCGMSRIRLRVNQEKLSENSATMAIWLGKQWLGQSDDPSTKQEFNGTLASFLEKLSNISLQDMEKEIAYRESEQEAD